VTLVITDGVKGLITDGFYFVESLQNVESLNKTLHKNLLQMTRKVLGVDCYWCVDALHVKYQ